MVVVVLHMACIANAWIGDIDCFVYCWKVELVMWGQTFPLYRLEYLPYSTLAYNHFAISASKYDSNVLYRCFYEAEDPIVC